MPQVMTSSENLKPSFVTSTLAGTVGSVKDAIIRFIRKELLGEGSIAKGMFLNILHIQIYEQIIYFCMCFVIEHISFFV